MNKHLESVIKHLCTRDTSVSEARPAFDMYRNRVSCHCHFICKFFNLLCWCFHALSFLNLCVHVYAHELKSKKLDKVFIQVCTCHESILYAPMTLSLTKATMSKRMPHHTESQLMGK